MGKTAFIFPGQGAQYAGMGKDFYDNFKECAEVYDNASKALGIDMCRLCFEENDELNITEYTQAAMVTTIGAMLEKIKQYNIKPDVCAGLSLGEYAAMVVSGVLSLEDAIALVRKRGIYMQEAVPTGGAMAAVLGMPNDIIEKVCSETEGIVSVANYNCPGQLVISGEEAAVDKASQTLKEEGAKRVVKLNVSGPFHSKMLTGAGEKLAKELENVTVNTPIIPYIANVTADYVTEAAPVKELLAKQVASSVKWQQTIEKMIEDGVDTFIEIGPGKTLSGFMKKINKDMKVINIDKVEDLEKLTQL